MALKAAAIQMEARLADLPYNIGQAGDEAERALRDGARMVALPEFFTTSIVYDERLYECSLPPDNPALDMMKALAARYEAMIGGSYLELRDGDVFNTYVLVDRDGRIYRHDKDQPTMVENAFYVGGNDVGLAETEFGNVGMAVCWETIRTRTLHRLAGKTDLLMTGSHWWSEPGWRLGRPIWEWLHNYNSGLMQRTPGLFARLVGAPNLHAAHCGNVEGQIQLTSRKRVATRTRLMGETQITDASGRILARRGADEGAGFIATEIEPGRAPFALPPNRFWIDRLPFLFRMFWAHQNAVGRKAYARAKADDRIKPYDWTRNHPL
ncbi:MAG: carbon-nitrogen hydrolase family protein [Sphingomonadaceae bacterium]|nr:carbon-nitrogen hydrolase family protein [Sphingomonadaceae bacterium]